MTARERNGVMWILAGFAVFGTWLFFFNRPHMDVVCQEDGFVEYSEAFLYLFAAAFFAYIGAHKKFRNIWYWGYALLFFGVCGEEVSWGQRIFDIATPAGMDAVNLQHEINIHNIDGLHQHHHLYGILVCTLICFAIPLTDRYVPVLRNLYARFNMPIFPLWAWSIPSIAFAFMIVPRLFGHKIFNFDEMGELYLALAFFGFGLSAYGAARPVIDRELARTDPARTVVRAPMIATPSATM